jgi:uncharacterized membrane protein (UPF0127 family)
MADAPSSSFPTAPVILSSPARKRSLAARLIAFVIIVGLVVALPLLTTMKGCDDSVNANVQSVKIGGQWFHLELAADEKVRMKGLGQRDHIEPDGGMLFVFSAPQPPGRGFVMRDCPIDIDIIYVDGSGRIGNWHAMKADPRGPGEGTVGETGIDEHGNPVELSEGAKKYEARLALAHYEARYPYQFAIELKGGTIESRLKDKIKAGDKVEMPIEALKKRAK